MPIAIHDRPNLVVVLFDCLRAKDFPGGVSPVENMPFAESLLRESLVFRRAVSPAPWTIPSHAALFTGLYPWESGVHAFHSLGLPENLPTLGEMLRPAGYRSLSLSANPFISPRFGLVRGFDAARWGGWWEAFIRTPREQAPNSGPERAEAGLKSPDRTMEWVRDGPLGDLLRRTSAHSFRYPWALDAGNRVLNRVRYPEAQANLSQTPWIEHELDRWLAAQDPATPVLCFLNLTDTHEPYYPNPEDVTGFWEWARLTRVRQDHSLAVSGEWKVSEEERAVLLELYRQSVRHLDQRLQAIVDVLKRNDRWDRTATVITSDHGQSLGEHGMMFHLLRLDEPLVRIPLWLRLPGQGRSGGAADGWASLIDVAPTFRELAGLPSDPHASGRSLLTLTSRERPGPVFSMADGIVWPVIRRRFSPERERVWDRPIIAAYEGDTKVVTYGTGEEVHAYDLRLDPDELSDRWSARTELMTRMALLSKSVADRLAAQGPGKIDAATEDRLRSWGYV